MTRIFLTLPLLLVATILAAGCGGDPDGVVGEAFKAANDSNLKRLRSLYAVYYSVHETAPKSEDELREMVESGVAEQTLRYMGVSAEDFDSIVINERDERPFIVEYGTPFLTGKRAVPLLAEEVGFEGTRLGIYTNGDVVELKSQKEVDDFFESAKNAKEKKLIVPRWSKTNNKFD